MRRAAALLILAASVPAGADIYKWTDANGRVHFGDSAAGAGQAAQAVTPSPPAAGTSRAGDTSRGDDAGASRTDGAYRGEGASRTDGAFRGEGASRANAGNDNAAGAPGAEAQAAPGTAAAQRERERRLLDALRLDQAQRDADARKQAEQQRELAQKCQRLREHLANMDGRAVYTTDANGERQYLDDTRRQEVVERVNAQLRQHCQ